MKTYRFETNVTMKPYNENKYWINRDYVGDVEFMAETLSEAIAKWVDTCYDCGVEISRNALKDKEGMYIDTGEGSVQVGYVITGLTEIPNEDRGVFTKQYVDLWVTIKEVSYVNFEEVV